MDARTQRAAAARTLTRSARLALGREGDDWYEPTARRARVLAHRMFLELWGTTPPLQWKRDLTQSVRDLLTKTDRGRDNRTRQAADIGDMLATLVSNAVLDEGADGTWEKTWRTMDDTRVRTTHREASGQTVSGDERFTVGGHEMWVPGDPSAPISEIINCRCWAEYNQTASLAASGGIMDDDTMSGMVPWYGVLAPEGVPTGDRRSFDADSLTWRDLPLPLRWQKVDAEGHDGSVVVGRIDTIDRRDGVLHATGVFTLNAEADEVVGLIADRAVRGVSVDLDDTTVEYRNSDGTVFDMDNPTGDAPVLAVKSGRICSAAICAIPAFREAFIALGYPPENEWGMDALMASTFAIDEKPWSTYPESAYDVAQWHNACLIHDHNGKPFAKFECKLPIRTPSGALSRAGVHAAASRVGQVKAPDADVAAAKAALVRAYKELKEDPPDSLVASADVEHEFSEEFGQHDLLWLENRRTPKVVSKGAKYEPTEAEGKIVKRRAATEAEEKTIRNGGWVRVNQDDKKPGQPGYMERRSGVRPQNNSAEIEEFFADSNEAVDQYVLSTTFGPTSNPSTKDGPGWVTNPTGSKRLRDYWVYGEGGPKIGWGLPGDFNRCRTYLAEYVKPQFLAGTCANLHKDALGFWPGQHRGSSVTPQGSLVAAAWTLVAAADPVARPRRSWFEDPEFTAVTPLTITDEGRVYGHLAQWGTCHVGFVECIEPPVTHTDYNYFHLGAVRTDQGDIPCGQITVGTGHAPDGVSGFRALAHYDNTGTVVARIRVGEDAHGIWFAGAIASSATPEQVDDLRGCKISGDWREYGGNLEMIAALGVNAPGFPIVRPSLAASAGRITSLVAAGLITVDTAPVRTDEEIADIVHRALQDLDEFANIKQAVITKRRAALASLGRGRN